MSRRGRLRACLWGGPGGWPGGWGEDERAGADVAPAGVPRGAAGGRAAPVGSGSGEPGASVAFGSREES